MRRREVRDERGAVAVLTAVLMSLVLLAVAAIAVDIGMQRVVRRDMQALADVVALHLARLMDGSTSKAALQGPASTARDASVARNTTVAGNAEDLDVDFEYGEVDAAGEFRSIGGSELPNAVEVTSRSSTDYAFAGVIQGADDRGWAARSAVASSADPTVCFSVGTKTLTLDTSQSALSPLLDSILKVNLDAVGYTGIVDLKNVYVPLADLLVELNVGSASELLTTDVSLADFIVATADALRANGDPVSAQLLEAIGLGVSGLAVTLGDILALDSGTDLAGLTADVNVLDILGAAIVAANGENAVNLSIDGLAELSIVEPPRIACGGVGAQAHSATIRLALESGLLNNAGLGLVGGRLELGVNVADATATLASMGCSPESTTLNVATGAVTIFDLDESTFGQIGLDITMGKFLNYIPGLGLVLRGLLLALGLDSVSLNVEAEAGVGTATTSTTFDYPAAPGMPGTVTVPDGGVDTLDLTGVGVRIDPSQGGLLNLLSGILNPVLEALLSGLVAPVLNQVVNPLVSSILNPLLDLLGIRLGTADVSMLSRPTCSAVRLVG